MEFSRQEYWSGLSFPSSGDLSDPEIKPGLLHLLPWQVDSLPLSHLGSPSVPNAGKQRKEVGIIKGQDAGLP